LNITLAPQCGHFSSKLVGPPPVGGSVIPALEKYAAVVEGHDQEADPPMSFDPPDDPALSKLWRFFLHEMDEILRHKYLRSKELGYDMGLSAAITEWLQKHRALWAAAHPPTAD